MDITTTILYLHPTLIFWVDFKVTNDGIWGGDIITWITETPTQPTQQELDAAWITYSAEQTKQSDINAFKEKDSYVSKLKQKKAELEEIYFNDWCPTENKAMILVVTDNLQLEINTEEANRLTLMTVWKANHWIGIATDYAEAIKKSLKWNI